jgi:CLIP-associating protein 1/2
MPGSELSPLLQPALLPGLFTAINHERTEVRKAAVFCLVEMWAALGERLSPHLEALNMTQRKLLTFYFTRRQEQASSGR